MEFYDKLTSLPASEVMFLVTTFTNMARSRGSEEKDFIEEVSRQIFEVCWCAWISLATDAVLQ